MIDDEDNDDNPFDKNGLLKDGRTYHVSLMDSARAHGFVMDYRPSGSFVADHRPGGPWVVDRRHAPSNAEVQDAKRSLADAYRAYDDADANAWRNPPNGPRPQCDAGGDFGRDIPAGAYPLSAGECSRCTVNGADGRLVRKGNWLVCEPTRANHAQALQDARAEAYRLYDEEMANAWRNPR
jgi:hypothetical protein